MKFRTSALAISLLCSVVAFASVGRNESQRRATELSQANGTAYHLIGNCMAGGERTCAVNESAIGQSLAKLDSNSLSAGSAAKYRQALVKIDEGDRYYAQAKASSGRERSRYVELGNDAMALAKALLQQAVQLFNNVLPRMLAGEGWGGGSGEDDEDREKRCQRDRERREKDCEDRHTDDCARYQKQWEREHAACDGIFERERARGATKEQAFRAQLKCEQDANHRLANNLEKARVERILCMQDAEERFERCLQGK